MIIDIDCISDTHGYYPKLDGGDLLIVAGDLTARDEPEQYLEFNSWLSKQDYRRKIVIAGNHDNCCQNGISVETHPGRISNCVPVLADKAVYLCDSGTEFEGLKIWGSPWSLKFPGMNPHCMAFTCDTEDEIDEKWAMIPHDTDILVTHSPPYGIFDETIDGKLAGSTSLLLKLVQIKPLIHCFGHIHEKGGRDIWMPWKNGTNIINASYVNEHYKPVNKPVRIIL